MPEIHARLTCLSFLQEQVTDEDVSVIERFVILVYSRTSLFHNVNAARKQMFYTVTGKLTKFHLPTAHFASINCAPSTRVAIFGFKCCFVILQCHPRQNGDGPNFLITGFLFGVLCQRRLNVVKNSSSAVAKHFVVDVANAARQTYHLLSYAFTMANVKEKAKLQINKVNKTNTFLI